MLLRLLSLGLRLRYIFTVLAVLESWGWGSRTGTPRTASFLIEATGLSTSTMLLARHSIAAYAPSFYSFLELSGVDLLQSLCVTASIHGRQVPFLRGLPTCGGLSLHALGAARISSQASCAQVLPPRFSAVT